MGDDSSALRPGFLSAGLRFRGSGIPSSLSLLDYWRWSASCLMDNTARGILAEFLVATALGERVEDRPRVEWDAYDLVATIGARQVTIEIKSSAKVQSWAQRGHSALSFGIAATRKWDAKRGAFLEGALRADVYVFCAFMADSVESHACVLDADQWRFRVTRGDALPDQKTISWSSLARVAPECWSFPDLAQAIETAAAGLA